MPGLKPPRFSRLFRPGSPEYRVSIEEDHSEAMNRATVFRAKSRAARFPREEIHKLDGP
jgi:hypothetical protein